MDTSQASQSTDAHLQLSAFKVFPKHVGVWEGDWIVLDAKGHESQRFRAVLTQKIANNQWIQTNQNIFPDGQTTTQNFIGTVVGEGQVQIETTNSAFDNSQMLAQEYGDDLLVFRILYKDTGRLRALETINLISASQRVRTTQSFTEDGKLRGFLLIVEQKLSDVES